MIAFLTRHWYALSKWKIQKLQSLLSCNCLSLKFEALKNWKYFPGNSLKSSFKNSSEVIGSFARNLFDRYFVRFCFVIVFFQIAACHRLKPRWIQSSETIWSTGKSYRENWYGTFELLKVAIFNISILRIQFENWVWFSN